MALINHPHFVAGHDGLMRAIDAALPGQLIFVIGLSGAGKTELRKLSMRAYAGAPRRWGPGRIPAISVRATPSDKSYFSPKDFINRLLVELDAPNLDWTGMSADGPNSGERRFFEEIKAAADGLAGLRTKRPEHELRLAFERLARARSLRAVFVDEAASMTYSHRGKAPGDHMVSYMCMAEEIPVVLVLFGVPRIKHLWTGNSEIRRRSRFVFLRRYTREDVVVFGRLVVTVAAAFQMESGDLLRENIDLIYHATMGSFGEVRSFLQRADESRILDGRSSITLTDLERAVYSRDDLASLHEDARLFDQLSSPADLSSTRASKRGSA